MLEQTFDWIGSEKLLLPLSSNLVGSTLAHAEDILQAFLTSAHAPRAILLHIIAELLQDALKSDSVSANTRDLLVVIRQRHQDLLDEVSQTVLEDDDVDQDALGQLLSSLAAVCSQYRNLGAHANHFPDAAFLQSEAYRRRCRISGRHE
jgi:hypothetical protein